MSLPAILALVALLLVILAAIIAEPAWVLLLAIGLVALAVVLSGVTIHRG